MPDHLPDSFLSADSAPEPDPEPDPNWMQAGSEPASGQLSSRIRSRGALPDQLPDSFLSVDSAPEPDPEPDRTGSKPDPNRPRDSFLRESGPGGVGGSVAGFLPFGGIRSRGALPDQLPDSFLSVDSAPEPDPEPDRTGSKPDPNRPRDSFLRESGPGGVGGSVAGFFPFGGFSSRTGSRTGSKPDPSRIRTGLGTAFFENQVQWASFLCWWILVDSGGFWWNLMDSDGF